jgi:hypothetical protein
VATNLRTTQAPAEEELRILRDFDPERIYLSSTG